MPRPDKDARSRVGFRADLLGRAGDGREALLQLIGRAETGREPTVRIG